MEGTEHKISLPFLNILQTPMVMKLCINDSKIINKASAKYLLITMYTINSFTSVEFYILDILYLYFASTFFALFIFLSDFSFKIINIKYHKYTLSH